ncbi:hypothetical protein TSUD_141870 [Trifolium subterraneum]|uniref:Reverse transcriptase zinc-binding domain-containing protein n=1 Tax=Trifolium subterraneum TaxID=3900 RepID=A0A2Z6LK25_TRISU|nr:hypothetical protein TSUD_141870 [Trifolium subterraneum]
MLVDKKGLWYQMFVAQYGEEEGRVSVGGNEVPRGGGRLLGFGMARMGRGWRGGLRRVLRGGLSTVAEMRDLGWGARGAAWLWRRHLWAWEEEMLEECRTLFSNIVLQENTTNQWVWCPDPGGGYSVRGAYDLLTFRDDQAVDATTELLWHKQVPLKVSVVAWRLLRNRLPTKDNLVGRNIINQDSHFCVAGCGGVETSIICPFPARFLLPCGVCSKIGWAYIQLNRSSYMIICFSLRTL